MWSAEHEGRTIAPPSAVWALWEDAGRWPDWNDAISWAKLEGPLAPGAEATVKFQRGRPRKFTVVELEPGVAFTDESQFPGARLGHAHSVRPAEGGSTIHHRLYLKGPFAAIYGAAVGRQFRTSLLRFVERERELAEGRG